MFRTGAKPGVKSTQAYLDIAAIKDGTVILKSGELRAVLMVSSVNFALKSPQEQEDIVLRYQGFLNSLHFPIQIAMQSRKLDLTDYLARLRTQAEGQANEQIRGQTTAYIAFMEKLLTVANIMDKRFYVVVTFAPPSLVAPGFISKLLNPTKQVTVSMSEEQFRDYGAQLSERAELISGNLSSMGLKSARLDTKQLIELFYATYNPEESVKERLVDLSQLQQHYVGDETLPNHTEAKNGTSTPGATNG